MNVGGANSLATILLFTTKAYFNYSESLDLVTTTKFCPTSNIRMEINQDCHRQSRHCRLCWNRCRTSYQLTSPRDSHFALTRTWPKHTLQLKKHEQRECTRIQVHIRKTCALPLHHELHAPYEHYKTIMVIEQSIAESSSRGSLSHRIGEAWRIV